MERLLEGLGELPPELGLVLQLKHIEGLTFDQIGERLAISPNTAKTRYYRGLDKLRGRLGQRTTTSAGGEA